MLNSLKKGYLTWFIGTFLVAVFIWVGIQEVFVSNKDPVLVKFKGLQPILRSELDQYRYVQLANNKNVNDTELINDLIRFRLQDALLSFYSLDCSNDTIHWFITKNPNFSDKDGKFDKQKFNQCLKSINMGQGEYEKMYKQDLLSNTVYNLFYDLPNSKILNSTIKDRILELRNGYVASINLDTTVPIRTYTDQDLKEIYDTYRKDFVISEKRSIKYFIINKPEKKEVSEAQITEYFST